ncbi:hypothetical protein PHLGIDRAFT_130998 [Phlebiopsis gigantea 11061_1 CR5-6]|uniref:EthD domain-containing protein n=1 Tax=Phlebiopsis gigantea (strain 11061_1 CR5-6) TaxID=745531 RepID=A0A0C3RQC3_PHLG1|nr:hypothetical protein PHLGIDRAFT_130998 [Phlebiopsis gigantea 11061_1 CR5-6]
MASRLASVYRAALQPNRVRLAAIFHPAAGVSPQQFSHYWLNEHGKIFISLNVVRNNLTKYEQFHFDTPLTGDVAVAMGSSSATASFYGMAVFEAESYDKIFQVFADPEYQRVVFPDEQKLLDRGRSQLFAGQVATVWEKARASEVERV